MIRTILVSALLAGTATTTMAADLVEPVPAAPEAVMEETQVYSWDGAYLGIFGGANWLRSDLDDGTLNRHGTTTGGTIGKFVGWNKQLDNNIVFGLEGDLKYEWNEKKYSGIETGTDWGGSARVRVGYAFDDALIYAAGGWTAANAFVDPVGPDNRKEKMINGWTLGAGVDYKFTDNIFARAEYRFNDYGKQNFSGVKADFQQHNAIIGIGYKF